MKQKITTVNTKPQYAVTYKMQNDHNLFSNPTLYNFRIETFLNAMILIKGKLISLIFDRTNKM